MSKSFCYRYEWNAGRNTEQGCTWGSLWRVDCILLYCRVYIAPLLPHTHSLPHDPLFPAKWHICYDWWTYMTHHYHPKFIVCLFSWGCTFFRFWQMYLLLHYTGWLHCPKNPLSFTYSSLSTSQPLKTINIFTIPTDLPFPECHTVGLVQYVGFSDGFFHLVIYI